MKFRIVALAALFASSALVPSAYAATTEKFSIVAGGESIGDVVAVTDGSRVTVDYRVDNNGRGPKHREEITMGAGKIPTFWTVAGTSLMGGPVDERFAWSAGRAEWKSQADAGSHAAAHTPLYVLNDDSPYAKALYARATMVAPGGTLDVLPGGTLKVTKVRDASIGDGAKAVAVSIYRLTGIQLTPTYIAFDRSGGLFAVLDNSETGSGGVTVRAGYEAEAPKLAELSKELDLQRVEDLQKKLAHNFAGPLRIDNVRVFDPRAGTLSDLSSVVVMRDTIVQVRKQADVHAVPEDEARIDGGGGTIYPGLHDMHSHATLESGLYYLAAGVTSTRDMGNVNSFMTDLLGRIASGEVAWPRITPSGFLEGRSPYSARMGFIPETLDAAISDVGWYADHGYPEIKIYNSFNPDWVKPVAAEAHRLGLRVSGHVPAFSSPDRVIGDGYDAIAHVNQLMLGWILDPSEDTRTPLRLTAMSRGGQLDLTSPRVRQTIDLMKSHGTALDSTTVILEMLMESNAGETPSFAEHYFDHMPIGWQRYRKRSYVDKSNPATKKAYDDGFAKILEVLKTVHAEGIRLLPGTDETTGLTLLREIELYVKAGLTPAEALRTATLGAEEYFGRSDHLGTIEQGKLADFVLVAGDPTKDITEIYRPRMVVRGGTVYFPSEIDAEIGIKPFASAPTIAAPLKMPKAGGAADASIFDEF
ncbi:amidohydrolase family protein [Novosphingobium sp. BL-8A]|uniref:amidohydrolase family protein n=1 Tax=Novosphingobium sp. BL-8A TaxID=3127639 RepID=UPI0037567647